MAEATPVPDNPPPVKPYRWGYFQGVILIPFSLLLLFGTAGELIKPTQHNNPAVVACAFVMGALGLPLAFGLLLKRRFALPLVYVMFSTSILMAIIQIPIAVRHFTDTGDRGSAFFEAEMLLLWLLSLVYYRKRRSQFR
jgi:hypothetical protein